MFSTGQSGLGRARQNSVKFKRVTEKTVVKYLVSLVLCKYKEKKEKIGNKARLVTKVSQSSYLCQQDLSAQATFTAPTCIHSLMVGVEG